MDENPVLYVLAGPPGAGKSSVLNRLLFSEVAIFDLDRIVADLEARSHRNAAQSARILFQQRLDQCVYERSSFGYETNFHEGTAGNNAIVERAKGAGFDLCLFYVGLPSPLECRKRVRDRVLKGGHYVPMRVIEERFEKGLQNLGQCLNYFGVVEIYDNADREMPAAGNC